ncbi:hypothetical protein [Methylobacterium mesophilicum]|uniref:hypothetical protein n=1 Tax=Methylobacterium mesophilicum TaxID=39956 RepID=UPI00177B2019|nr:hypothetical protein [Methylobacterium mesophilicum]
MNKSTAAAVRPAKTIISSPDERLRRVPFVVALWTQDLFESGRAVKLQSQQAQDDQYGLFKVFVRDRNMRPKFLRRGDRVD